MAAGVQADTDHDPHGDHLVKIKVVVERDDSPKPRLVPEPRDGVPTHREEDQGHVELQDLGPALRDAQAFPHNPVRGLVLLSRTVLYKLVREQSRHGRDPDRQDPDPLPIIHEEVLEPVAFANHHIGLERRLQLLAKDLAHDPAVPDADRLVRGL
ncbi:hypothetical protein MLD38_004269 [Melastoma candidum]|uniref:Uncharacterized protein n=1 Tax=Melastoma candidum TaxID=119954 RepID=A0ACB9S9U0_9MYRT|nr:hypothetical protein MLD38_004269 [Melastoma candidum]